MSETNLYLCDKDDCQMADLLDQRWPERVMARLDANGEMLNRLEVGHEKVATIQQEVLRRVTIQNGRTDEAEKRITSLELSRAHAEGMMKFIVAMQGVMMVLGTLVAALGAWWHK